MQKLATKRSHAPGQQNDRRVSWWVRLLQEPLLHFFLLGIVLFVAAYYWGDASAGPEDNEIIVTEAKVRSLAHFFQRTWQRPPTQQELDGLIQDYVNEEVFYREALAMGLDQDDTVIRRRLRQKLEFVAEDFADAIEPTDDELARYFHEHPDQYRLEDRTTFTQIYFSPQRHGESLDQDMQQALDALRSSDDEGDVTEIGDPTLLPIFNESLRETEIANLLGREFGLGLKEAGTGIWAGPIESSYGLHLVKIHQRTPGRVPNFDEVCDAVRRDWFARRRAQSKQQFYDSLRERYEVIVEMPGEEEPGSNASDVDAKISDSKESP